MTRTTPVLALILVFALGCGSQLGFGRARTIPAGTVETHAAVTANVSSVRNNPDHPTPMPWPDLMLGVRVGLAERVEAGARLWGVGIDGLAGWGATLDAKVGILVPEGRGWNVAAALSVGYEQIVLGGTPSHVGTITVPILFGLDVGRDQLVFGPRFLAFLWGGEGQGTIEEVAFGMNVGYSFQLGSRFQLMPELVVHYSPVGFDGEDGDPAQHGAWTFHLGLGGALRL
jgi:hypothetical protein